MTVTVVPPVNDAPLAVADGDLTVTRPHSALLWGGVYDDGLPYGYPLTFQWAKVSGPGDVTFTVYPSVLSDPPSVTVNATDWEPVDGFDAVALANFSAAGQYVLSLSASDTEFTNTDTMTITVLAGTNYPPCVNAGPDLAVGLPEPAILHTEVYDDGLEYGWVETSWSAVSGPGPVYFSTLNGAYRATFITAGDYVLRLTAYDGTLTNSDEVAVTVYDTPAPVALIEQPLDGGIITAPSNIIGTASSPILQSYVLEYRMKPAEGADETIGNPQSAIGNWTVLASGSSSVLSNVLGTLDPTLALNGIYELRLTATDLAGRTSTTEPITVIFDRNLKIGHFTISFNDLTVPLAGIPIEITRTYDSRNKAQGDFGIGWTLDVKNIRMQKNRPLSRNWIQYRTGSAFDLSLAYHLDPIRERLVSLTFPDGRVEKYRFEPNPRDQALWPIEYPQWRLVPVDNTRGALNPPAIDLPDGQFLYFAGAIPGTADLYDLNYFYDSLDGGVTQEDLERYPRQMRFTSAEGIQYLIDEQDGVRSLSDRNGNSLTITTNGIFHSSGVSVTFVRDDQGRIAQVIDPAGNALNYGYGTNGSLATFTDRETNTVSFAYTNLAFPHYLTEITDPRGIKALRTEYDEQGRMIRQIDSAGNVIEFTHDLANRREILTDRLGNTTIHEYDDNGNVIRTTDALNNVTSYAYDAADNLIEQVDALGNTNRYTYDFLGNKLTETDPLGNTTRYTYGAPVNAVEFSHYKEMTSMTTARGFTTTNRYDGAGNLIEMRDALGNATRFSYDAGGNLITQTDALGNVTSNRYSLGRLTYTTTLDAQGSSLNETWFTYDSNGNQTAKIAKRTKMGAGGLPETETLTTRYIYDRENRLVQTIHPDGSTNATIYATGLDKPAVEIDALGRQTWHFYDQFGNETNTVHPDGASESVVFDAEDRKIAETDAAGRTTFYTNDPLGRLTATVYPDGSVTNTFYDEIGRISATRDERGNVTWFGYDPNCGCSGRQAFITNALGQVTHRSYDQNSNEESMTDALGRTFTYVYDPLDRRTHVVFPDGSFTVTTYDALGRRIAETDQSTNTTWYAYDALGRLLAVTNALGHVTQYTYDEVGSVISQTDAEGRTTTFEYDSMGRRIKRTLPLGQVETYAYDLAGNLTNRVDFNGHSTVYTYDAKDRLLSKTPDAFFGAPPVTFTYTATGQRATMSDASGTTLYDYNSRDWLTNKTWQSSAGVAPVPFGASLRYSYDACGNLAGIQSSSANGVALGYTYDALNRLESVTDARTGTTVYGYDAVGNLAGYAYPNGLTTTYEYDALNRLTNLATHTAQLAPVAWYRYTVAPSGHRLTAAENVATGGGVQTIHRLYSYDATYRLVNESLSVSGPLVLPASADVGYTLDDVGNRLARTSTLPGVDPTVYGYDANDRLTSDTYDANGNTVAGRVSASAPLVNDTYDFEDRLIQRQTTINSQPTTINIWYDGDGNRVAKTVNGVTTIYLVDDRNPSGYAQVMEEHVTHNSSTPTLRVVYSYGHDLVSQDRLLDDGQGGFVWVLSFYGYDGHGTVRHLSGATGEVTDTYDFDAFGTPIAQTGETPNNYLYCGEQFDADLGLYYNRARYMNADSGRFWTIDALDGSTADPISLHKYLYADANPVANIDPSGYLTLTEAMASLREQIRIRMPQIQSGRKGMQAARKALCGAGRLAFTAGLVYYGGHHIYPKFAGGDPRQILAKLNPDLHRILHNLIQALVKDDALLKDLNALGGKKGSGDVWKAALRDPEKAKRFLQILKKATEAVDKFCGFKPPATMTYELNLMLK